MTTNAVMLEGRASQEAQTFANEQGVRFGLAVDDAGYQKGAEESQAGFFNVVAFGNPRASQIASAIKKGTPVFIIGRLQHSRWQTDDGQKRSNTEVVATKVVTEDVGKSSSGGSSEASEASDNADDDDSDFIDF